MGRDLKKCGEGAGPNHEPKIELEKKSAIRYTVLHETELARTPRRLRLDPDRASNEAPKHLRLPYHPMRCYSVATNAVPLWPAAPLVP